MNIVIINNILLKFLLNLVKYHLLIDFYLKYHCFAVVAVDLETIKFKYSWCNVIMSMNLPRCSSPENTFTLLDVNEPFWFFIVTFSWKISSFNFSFIVDENIPKLSYLTFLDFFILSKIYSLILIDEFHLSILRS